MCFIFWTKLLGKKNMYKEYALFIFTVGNVVISIILLTIKALMMDFGGDSWSHYQCWGIMISSAPWGANILLYLVKLNALRNTNRALSKAYMFFMYVPEETAQSFQMKQMAYGYIFFMTCVALVLLDGPYFLTHLLPTFISYIPFIIAPGICCCVYTKWLFDLSQYDFLSSVRSGKADQSLNLIPLAAIPLALFLESLLQWLATTAVYLYQGMGYWQAAWVTTTERRSDIYFNNFVDQVLGHLTWFSEFFNEMFP